MTNVHGTNVRQQTETTNRQTPRGFTLIELLVVVAIMALLMAILMPALAKARDNARRVACLSNMKQLTTGLRMYAENNEDCPPPAGPGFVYGDVNFPDPYATSWSGTAYVLWYSKYYLGAYIGNTTLACSAKGGNYASTRVVACPASPYSVSITSKTSSGATAIGYNNVWNNNFAASKMTGSSVGLRRRKLNSFTEPWRTVMFIDTAGSNTWNNWTVADVAADAPSFLRHSGFANVGFADGHSDSIRYQATDTRIATANSNP